MEGPRGSTREKAAEEICEALRRAQNDLPSFRSTIANKHSIIFLGNTRSGKSTLVNYVIGTKLTAFSVSKDVFKIKKAQEDDAKGPTIGQGVQSCTSIPGVYPLNQYNMVVIDAPGFDDNRSEAQDIVNALYINQVIYAKTVKFVLVSDINDLMSDNIKGFTDLIAKIHMLVPNFETLKASVSIVFTKEERECSRTDLTSLLQQKVLNVEGLTINKELIRHFVDNPDVVAIFRMPLQAGEVTHSIDDNIENARFTSCAVILDEKHVKVALSPKSRLALMKIYQQHLDSSFFEEQVSKIVNNFSKYFAVDDYVFASLNDELTDVKQNLNRISKLFDSELKINSNMSNLCEIKNSLVRIFTRTISMEFSSNLNTLVMIDDALLMEDAIKAKFVTKYKQALSDVLEKVKKLTTKVEDEMKDREKNRTLFRASAGTSVAAGGMGAVGGIVNKVCAEGSKFGTAFGILGIVGGVISAIGAGVAGSAYVVQKERQKKRIEARRRQERQVHDNMFEDD